jgi:hypothetical protein
VQVTTCGNEAGAEPGKRQAALPDEAAGVLLAGVELEEVPEADDPEVAEEDDESLELEDELSPEEEEADDSLLAAPDAAADPFRESVR